MKYVEFEQYLDEDLAWRKKELSALFLIGKNQNQEVILKSIILLLYAHWEGYIKRSSKLYMKYVSDKNIKITQLLNNFTALALKRSISKCFDSRESSSVSNELKLLETFSKISFNNFKINIDPDKDLETEIINTKSNLNPKVFKDIISIIGLNYKKAIATREKYIDNNLLANRNCIGHGSPFDSSIQNDFSLNLRDIEKLKDIIFLIIDTFRDDLLEYVRKEFYLDCNKKERAEFDATQDEHIESQLSQIESNYDDLDTSAMLMY